jgi:hypothetical protein
VLSSSVGKEKLLANIGAPDDTITNRQIYHALGMSSSTYYRRTMQDDFPNADELHKIADKFCLSFPDLQVRLGFVTREDLEGYVGAYRLSIAPIERSHARLGS